MLGRKPRRAISDDVVDDDTEVVADATDPRSDGPFDHTEVDLASDGVDRIAFGPVVITPFDGLNIQLHGDPETGQVLALLASYEESGLELALFAAPRSGGLAADMTEEMSDEAAHAGGTMQQAEGPFGTELRRVLPMEGPEGEQLFHVSRIWLVEGPRWLLRGTLMGRAALVEGEEPPADLFTEFFRNVVIRRDNEPRVPGELIHLAVPDAPVQA